MRALPVSNEYATESVGESSAALPEKIVVQRPRRQSHIGSEADILVQQNVAICDVLATTVLALEQMGFLKAGSIADAIDRLADEKFEVGPGYVSALHAMRDKLRGCKSLLQELPPHD